MVSQFRPSSDNFRVRNPNPVLINPRPRNRRIDTSRPVIDTDCTTRVKWATKPGPPGRDGKDGAIGPRGPKGDPGDTPSDEHIARIVVAVVNQMKDELRGQDGAPGMDGKDADLSNLDYDQITREVLRRLPPIRVEQPVNGTIQRGEVYLDGTLKLYHADLSQPES